MSLNEVRLLGNVGKDCDMKHSQSGNAVAKFSLATTESYKKEDGEWVNNTTWHNIVCFGKTAEYCAKSIIKGAVVFVGGKISISEYADSNGDKKSSFSIIADKVLIISGKKENSDNSKKDTDEAEKKKSNAAPSRVDDDLPF